MDSEKMLRHKANKHVERLKRELIITSQNEVIQNPYTGKRIECDPLSVALYDYLNGVEWDVGSGNAEHLYGKQEARRLSYSAYLVRTWFGIN